MNNLMRFPVLTYSSRLVYVLVLLLLAGGLMSRSVRAEQFNIEIGNTLEEDWPADGAGRLDASDEIDVYRFTAAAGQLVFFDELYADEAFEGWLCSKLLAPSGEEVFTEYIDTQPRGRVQLPESGTYQLRVWAERQDPSYVGVYSLGLYSIPPDSVHSISVGDTVSPDQPQSGAGVIEAAGARDIYMFNGSAGQHVFFEEVSDDPAFEGWLRWELFAPSGENLFSAFFDTQNVGRKTLPESGTYSLVVAAERQNSAYFGEYSFRLRSIPPDQEFAIQIGATVSAGAPAAGAGRIEVAGARDIYRFQASAGTALYLEDLSAEPEFEGWLCWELRSPSSEVVCSDYFDGTSPGRRDLTESGTYEILVYATENVPTYIGAYSFRVTQIGGDTRYPITLGQIVASGAPGPGAGNIESAGGEDLYRFEGAAGLKVIFEEIAAAQSFEGWLLWELKRPSGAILAARYFDSEPEASLVLPEPGTYTVRVYSSLGATTHTGAYSFRVYSPVQAWADQLLAAPGKALVVPAGKFFCNDTHEPGDALTIELPLAESTRGGVLALTDNGVSYTAPTGFTGIDTFTYRIRGAFGGTSTAVVTVRVHEGAEGAAMVVSVNRTGPSSVRVCLLGRPDHTYQVEESTDLNHWTFRENLTSTSTGEMLFHYETLAGPPRFFRFK